MSKIASMHFNRFEGKRRDDCELATALRPAAGLGDRPRFATSLVEPIESGIGIGL
jgi:hypothetical protein